MGSNNRLLLIAVVETLAMLALFAAVLFGCAGTVRVPMFWAYLGVNVPLYLLALLLVFWRSPDLVRERMKPGAGERDRISIAVMMAVFVLHYAVAGLDAGRFHWSAHFPVALQVVGLAAFAGGFLFVLWPMLVNPYFSSAVRLQEDRGQKVVTSGPYRFVRHPGYTGGVVFLVASGLALGSWPSTGLMLLLVPVIIRRTLIEDRMLKDGLPGYAEYARTVPYRLIPGVW